MTESIRSKEFIEVEGQLYSEETRIHPKTACKILNVSDRTLRRMTQRGDIPAFRYNPFTTRYKVADLMDFLEEAYTASFNDLDGP